LKRLLLGVVIACALVGTAVSNAATHCNRGSGPCRAAGYRGFPPGHITYHGGPVQHHPTVYVVLTGHWKVDDPRVTALDRFYRTMGRSAWGRSLSVYGVRTIRYGGQLTYRRVSSIGHMATLAWRAGRRFGVHDWRDAQFVIVPAPGTRTLGYRTECGEHDAASRRGHPIYSELLVVPLFRRWSACTADYSTDNGVHADNVIRGLTVIASHELAETATDPAWPLGWADSHTIYGTVELADLCWLYSSQWPGLGAATWLWSASRNACYPVAH
jgi:hypothetical protein